MAGDGGTASTPDRSQCLLALGVCDANSMAGDIDSFLSSGVITSLRSIVILKSSCDSQFFLALI